MAYLPEHFNQTDQAEIEGFLKEYPFATVITIVDGNLWPTQIPLFLRGESLIGHVARQNEMWRHDQSQLALAVFSGPHAYITPNWYETKHLTQESVPTWNYASVSIWGDLILHDDDKFKRMAVGMLTKIHEADNEVPWKMGDAPQAYLNAQLEHIIGIEIPIARLEAKWKLNQNRTESDRMGVVEGLTGRGRLHDAAMAAMMQVTLDGDDN